MNTSSRTTRVSLCDFVGKEVEHGNISLPATDSKYGAVSTFTQDGVLNLRYFTAFHYLLDVYFGCYCRGELNIVNLRVLDYD